MAIAEAEKCFPEIFQKISEVKIISKSSLQVSKLLALILSVWQTRPNTIFLCYGDQLVYLIPILRLLTLFKSMSVQLISFRGRFCPSVYPSWLGGVKKFLVTLYLKLGIIQKIFLVDDLVYKDFSQISYGLENKVIFLPDPMPNWQPISKGEARRYLKLSENKKYILGFGSLSPRKGLSDLLELVEQKMLPQHACLLLVGKPDVETNKLIEKKKSTILDFENRVILRTEFVQEKDISFYFAASDVVMANYIDHVGSSGVVLKALAMKRPVIGPNCGWIGWAIGQANVDWLYVHGDKKDFRNKLFDALEKEEVLIADCLAEFKSAHSEGGFVKILQENLG